MISRSHVFGRSSIAACSSLAWFFVLLFIITMAAGGFSFQLRKVVTPSSSLSYSLAEEYFRLRAHLAQRVCFALLCGALPCRSSYRCAHQTVFSRPPARWLL